MKHNCSLNKQYLKNILRDILEVLASLVLLIFMGLTFYIMGLGVGAAAAKLGICFPLTASGPIDYYSSNGLLILTLVLLFLAAVLFIISVVKGIRNFFRNAIICER